MKTVSGKELTRVLERNGWLLLRVHGSHHIYGKAAGSSGSPSPFTVTSH
jgi:predicted RNA binding protein YcfA (HicA-like mRNA interferase family)